MPDQAYEDSQLYKIRHSAAHVLAEAMLERFPDAKTAIGPPIEDGFYYDFDLPAPITDADIKWVERRMRKILGGKHEFRYQEVSPDEARALFHDQPYKLELISDLLAENGGATLSVYTQRKFTDLCRGPHVESTADINAKAVSISLRPPAGAYWRGDENRQQLTRIYGTAWNSPAELAEHRQQLQEAAKRDHRVLGEKLDLFIIDSMVGKGLPLWLPNGTTLRDTLERWLRDIQVERGYLPVITPHLGNIELYKTSGHYPYYADSQYTPIDVDGDKFMLRPMNCPHHCRIYASQPRSYRDLPLRYAEFGTVYRYEQSGELRGLTRARGFTVDDAHLFVRPDQLQDEFIGVVHLIQDVFGALGMTDFRALHRLNADHRRHQTRVQFTIIMHMRAEAGGHALRHHLKDAAQGILVDLDLMDGVVHFDRRLRIGAAHIVVFTASDALIHGHVRQVCHHIAQLRDVAIHGNAKFSQKCLAHRANRNAHGRLARARPFQRKPQFAVAILDRAGQIGVPGPRRRKRRDIALFPAFEIAVAHLQRNWRAGRQAIHQARGNDNAVLLDLHAPAGAVAFLPPPQIDVDVFRRQGQASWHPFENGCQTGSVALAGGEESNWH